MQNHADIIKKYYDFFNSSNLESFIDLLSEDVIHDLNQESRQIGKEPFLSFMREMSRCYKETISDLVILKSDTMNRYAAEFIVTGQYIATDINLPEAKGQTYELAAGAFFEIKNDKISRVTSYYNLNEWMRIIKEQA